MYKLHKNIIDVEDCVIRIFDNASIPFDPTNTDYANFKKSINEETAELQDADGKIMTAAEAKAYIATLP